MRSISQAEKEKGKMTPKIIHIYYSPTKEESSSSYVIENYVKPKNPFGNIKHMPSSIFKFIYGRKNKKQNHSTHQLDKEIAFTILKLLNQDWNLEIHQAISVTTNPPPHYPYQPIEQDSLNLQIVIFSIIKRHPRLTKYRKHKLLYICMPQNIHLHNVMLLEAKICQGNPNVVFKTIPFFNHMHEHETQRYSKIKKSKNLEEYLHEVLQIQPSQAKDAMGLGIL